MPLTQQRSPKRDATQQSECTLVERSLVCTTRMESTSKNADFSTEDSHTYLSSLARTHRPDPMDAIRSGKKYVLCKKRFFLEGHPFSHSDYESSSGAEIKQTQFISLGFMFLDDSFFLSRHKLDCKNMEVHFQVKLKGNKLLAQGMS